jgi:hypothetical protein
MNSAMPALIYHPCVEADFAVELGPEDETLELPWAAPEDGPRYCDLKKHPELFSNIEEARRFPALGQFLAVLNSTGSLFETAKCDAWSSREIKPEEEIFGAACKFGSYVDLVFCSDAARLSLPEHERRARQLTQLLQRAPEMPSASEFLIRRCYYHLGDEIHEGFYLTFYLFGYGDDEPEARKRWIIALKLVENAIRQLSAAG